MQKTNVIELNGKHYNARTGELVKAAVTAAKTPPAKVESRGMSVDGFIRPKGTTHAKQVHAPKAHPAARPSTAQVVATKPIAAPGRHSAQKLNHHAPKRSQTLMRSAVQKPAPGLKRHTKTVPHSDAVIKQPKFQITKKLAHPTVDPSRKQRAAIVARSPHVRRYAPDGARIAPQATVATATTPSHQTVASVAPATASGSGSLDIFERALKHANSHMERAVAPKKARRRNLFNKRALGVGLASLAVVLLAGVFAYHNQANLTVRYAASKAGFSAKLPAYKPAGYTVGNVTYSPGRVQVQYTGNSGGSFSLLQKESAWDSATLLSSYVESRSSSYDTIASAGRTIFSFGNTATWVNGGVWYVITADQNLDTQQLVNLATSM